MTVPFAETAALALVESATRVFPLADGGHAALLEMLADVELPPPLLHFVGAGTWLAMLVACRSRAAAAIGAGVRAVRRPGELGKTAASCDAQVLALGSVAMLIVELSVRERAHPWGREPMLVGAGLLVSAAAVASTLWAPRGSRTLPTLWGAVLVGAVEGAGALPGLSQTGLALTSLLWLGLTEESAFELCFLTMIPAEAALALIHASDIRAALDPVSAALALLGLGTGLLALALLRRALRRRLLPSFSLYLVPLGVATLAWGYARP
jgi:undecaprenyl-diphosphatase